MRAVIGLMLTLTYACSGVDPTPTPRPWPTPGPRIPTPSPTLIKIAVIESGVEVACDEFVRQEAESYGDSPALLDAVETAYTEALDLYAGMRAGSRYADAVRRSLNRIASIQRYMQTWWNSRQARFNGDSTALARWRTGAVQTCAGW